MSKKYSTYYRASVTLPGKQTIYIGRLFAEPEQAEEFLQEFLADNPGASGRVQEFFAEV